jgi:hypothetical protein
MRLMFATLDRLATSQPTGLRILFATMAVVARADADRWARASYLEGLLGYSPGTFTNNIRQLDEAEEAIDTGAPNRIAEALLYERGMSEAEAKALVGDRDRKLPEALMAGVSKYLPSGKSYRGQDAQDIAQWLLMGISPSTMKPFPQYKGGNMFYFLGTQAPAGLSMGGIARVVRDHAAKKTFDYIRGTTSIDLGLSLSDSGPASQGRGPTEGPESVLEDVLSGESAVSRADYITMAESIFQNPAIMRKLDQAVRQFLGGPGQIAVWEVVKENPNFIQVKGSAQGEPVVGLDQEAAAKEVVKLTGQEISPQAVGKTWRTKVWPAMRTAFRDSDVARALLRNRQIMEIIDEETRRRHNVQQKIRDIRYVGEGVDYGAAGPGMELEPGSVDIPEPAGRSDEYEREMARMRRKYNIPMGVKFASLDEREFQRWVEARNAAVRVAAKWAQARGFPVTITDSREAQVTKNADGTKLAWRLPPREAQMYNRLLAWAKKNWERFRTPRGDLNTDALAEELAHQAGKDWWADDPTHWVYEIAYDVNRLAPSLAT